MTTSNISYFCFLMRPLPDEIEGGGVYSTSGGGGGKGSDVLIVHRSLEVGGEGGRGDRLSKTPKPFPSPLALAVGRGARKVSRRGVDTVRIC